MRAAFRRGLEELHHHLFVVAAQAEGVLARHEAAQHPRRGRAAVDIIAHADQRHPLGHPFKGARQLVVAAMDVADDTERRVRRHRRKGPLPARQERFQICEWLHCGLVPVPYADRPAGS